MDLVVESVIISFLVGGILGGLLALQLGPFRMGGK